MNIFYCDIVGTITGGSIENLVVCLNKIIERDNLDSLYFSFVTSNSIEDLKEYLIKLSPYLNEKIILGTQFCENHQIEPNGTIIKNNLKSKIDQIKSDIKNKTIKSIYYADDQRINTLLFEKLICLVNSKIKYAIFMPGNSYSSVNVYGSEMKGINGLEESINKYLVKKI